MVLLAVASQHLDQRRGVEGLGQIGVHAGIHSTLGVLGEGVRREGDDGHGLGIGAVHFAYGCCDPEAVHVGHAQIHENHFEKAWLRIDEELAGDKAVFGVGHGGLGFLEDGGGALGVDGLIRGEQHPHALEGGKSFFYAVAFGVLVAGETGQGAVEMRQKS